MQLGGGLLLTLSRRLPMSRPTIAIPALLISFVGKEIAAQSVGPVVCSYKWRPLACRVILIAEVAMPSCTSSGLGLVRKCYEATLRVQLHVANSGCALLDTDNP